MSVSAVGLQGKGLHKIHGFTDALIIERALLCGPDQDNGFKGRLNHDTPRFVRGPQALAFALLSEIVHRKEARELEARGQVLPPRPPL